MFFREKKSKKNYIELKKNETKLKLEQILNKFSFDELLSFLLPYFKAIHSKETNNIENKENYQLIGIHAGGSFLAHLFNIIYCQAEQTVWLYQSKPYPTLIPRFLRSDDSYIEDSRKKKKIVFDELSKTGFAFSTYISLLLETSTEVEASLHPLFYFENYSKNMKNDIPCSQIDKFDGLKINTTVEKYYVVNVENNKHIFSSQLSKEDYNTPERKTLESFFDVYDGVLNNHKKNIKENFFNCVVDYDKAKKPEKIDINILLSNSNTLFYIANFFANKIIEKMGDKKDILLYNITRKERLLVFILAFIIKRKTAKCSDPIKFYFKKDMNEKLQKDENIFKVAVSYYLLKGTTLAYGWTIDSGLDYFIDENIENVNSDENQENILNKIDLVLSILRLQDKKIEMYEEITNKIDYLYYIDHSGNLQLKK